MKVFLFCSFFQGLWFPLVGFQQHQSCLHSSRFLLSWALFQGQNLRHPRSVPVVAKKSVALLQDQTKSLKRTWVWACQTAARYKQTSLTTFCLALCAEGQLFKSPLPLTHFFWPIQEHWCCGWKRWSPFARPIELLHLTEAEKGEALLQGL